jgi:uncharacterized membrane-anchored protein
MKNVLSVFKNMNVLDWVLAAAFTVLVAYVVNSIFPPQGWLIGLAVSLALLYLAKRRRDNLAQRK